MNTYNRHRFPTQKSSARLLAFPHSSLSQHSIEGPIVWVSQVLVTGCWWGSCSGHGQGNTEGENGAEGAALGQLGKVLVNDLGVA